MILIYRILTNILYPLLILIIYFRKILKKEDPIRYKEKIFSSHFRVERKKDSKLIWFHAASVGEFKSILPIIKELISLNKNLEFLITTTTLSSSYLAKEELERIDGVCHRFIPIDVNFLIKKFLILWKPDIIFLVDSEIWPNLILNASEIKIKLGIINARITEKTFKKWIKIPNSAKKIFSCFDLCLASNLETKLYLEQLNVKNIKNSGNIKLINNLLHKKILDKNFEFLSKGNIWLAASTHRGEENVCLETHLELKKKIKDIVTIIAPRHINRSSEIKKLCDSFNLDSQILNKDEIILKNKDIIIINSFGVLSNFYKFSKSVFIGKSMMQKLKNVGGQSPIEAAQLGCKIYHGPYVYNFNEIYKILGENGISEKIEDSSQLTNKLLNDFVNLENKKENFSVLMNNLSQATLAETMKNINNFIFNACK